MTYHATPGHVTDSEVDYFRGLIRSLCGPLTFLTIARTTSGTTLVDWSGQGYNFTASASLENYLQHTTRSYHYDFDGTNLYAYMSDNPYFSFGNGTTDSPFSMFALVTNDSNSGTMHVMSKYDASGDKEYYLGLNTSGYPVFYLSDTGSGSLDCRSNSKIGTGTWYSMIGTYDGTSTTAGIKIYINGLFDDVTQTKTSYTAMHNTTVSSCIGGCVNGASYTNKWDGYIACVGLVAKELTEHEAWALNRYMRAFWGVNI